MMSFITLNRPPEPDAEIPDRSPGWSEGPRHILLRGLGVLWLVDGLLQMQPGMFTMDMVSNIMQPAATGEPTWLSGLIGWSIHVVTPHLVPFNWGVVVLQLLIGTLLLMPRERLVRSGLRLSVVWGLTVWLFGEGLGQLFTGTATFLTGAPGSVLLYVVASVLLLLPGERWPRPRRDKGLDAATWTVSLTLILGGLLQLSPVFWTGLGLSAPFGSGAMMPQPPWIRQTLSAAASAAMSAPWAVNGVIVVMLLGLGMLLILRPSCRWVLWATLGWLAVTWWFGQDLGMIFGGMATDPNTAPMLAVLLWAGWTPRSGKRPRPSQGFIHPNAARTT